MHRSPVGGGNGEHGVLAQGREGRGELVWEDGSEEEMAMVARVEGERVQGGRDKGALPLYPKVFDSELKGMKGALGKKASMPSLLGVLGF